MEEIKENCGKSRGKVLTKLRERVEESEESEEEMEVKC